ncbi:MAG: adenylate/guanylate cyclase domain-containing protein, partial [Candidatus Rokuibacteriota bacterium]
MVVLAGAGILGLRSVGVLESVELAAYDWYIRLRPFDPGPDRRILLVTVTESDLQAQSGWPLSDRVVAQMLEILARSRPRAIGLDIYRDVPVPPGTDQLHAVLTRERRIITVMKFGEGSSGGVRPPPVLRDTDQVAFDDVLVDAGGTVRRGLLFLDDGTKTAYSFALRLALLYLQAEGVHPQASEKNPGQLRLAHTTIRP